MGSISTEKIQRLSTLLSGLPEELVGQLVSISKDSDPALSRMLNYCHWGEDKAACNLLFAPLEQVIGDRAITAPSKALIPQHIIEPLWRWASEELTPDIADTLRSAVRLFDEDTPAQAFDEARQTFADAIQTHLASLDDDPKTMKRLRHRLGVSSFDEVRTTAEALHATPAIRYALNGLPEQIDVINDELSAELRDRYEQAAEAQPEAGVWVLLMTMGRLEKPWNLLRVFERIAKRDDDFLLSRTDMSSVGDALLNDAEFYLDGFAKPPSRPEETIKAAEALQKFSAVTVGMTREIGIRKDGAWGQRLFSLRNKASQQMEVIHEVAETALTRALPEMTGSRRLRSAPRPGEPDYDKAEALCGFLLMTKDDASRAAVSNSHARLLDDLRERAEKVGNIVLNKLRNGQSSDEAADNLRLCEVVRLMEALGEEEAGALLLRRAAAVKAA